MYKIINRTLIFVLVSLIIVMVCKNLFKLSMNSPAEVATTVIEKPAELELTKEQVEVIINNYLMNNPELIVASIEQLQKKGMKATSGRVNCSLTDASALSVASDFPIKGNPIGDPVIEVLYDYNCSYCKNSGKILDELVKKDDKVKIVLRPLPVLGENSTYLAKLMMAIYMKYPNKFQEIHNEILARREATNEEDVSKILASHGVDYQEIQKNLDSTEISSLLNKNLSTGKELQVRGVPSYIINGVLGSSAGTLEGFEKIIKNVRSKEENN